MSQWLASKKMGLASQVQVLDNVARILLSANAAGKGMNLSFQSLAMGK